MKNMPAFLLHIQDKTWPQMLDDPESLAQRALHAACEALGEFKDGETSIVLASDSFQNRLNRTWRGQDKPTNVLAFPAKDYHSFSPEEVQVDDPVLGDIVLAYETVAQQALEQNLTLKAHTTHLVIHGFLHLQGYDHQTDDEERLMMALEKKALASLGFEDPYKEAVS